MFSLISNFCRTDTLIEDDRRSRGPIPSSLEPSIHSGPSRKNEKRRAKEIAEAQRWVANGQEMIDRYDRESKRRAVRHGLGQYSGIPINGPIEGFQVPGGDPSGGQQGGGDIPMGVSDPWGGQIFVRERRGPRRGRGGIIWPGMPIVGEVPNGRQEGGGSGGTVDAGEAEPGHKMFPTVRGPEKNGIFPTQADGKPAKPTPYNYAEPPGLKGGGGFGGMGGSFDGMDGMR
jgi:hypothetical protein